MKNNLIIANWKMNLNQKESSDLVRDLLKRYNEKEKGNTEIVICPGFTALAESAKKLLGSKIMLGAQDCFWEEKGAFTGEISPIVLKDIGCRYVIVGHSERRTNFHETDEMVNKKIKILFKHNLIPVLCVGETFDERQSGDKDYVIMKQVQRALDGVDFGRENKLIVAYEPVWVIGSGQAVASEEAEHTNQVIRQVLLDQFSLEIVKEHVHFIYGGSVNSNNIREFIDRPTIEGHLIGAASLKADEFWGLVKAIS